MKSLRLNRKRQRPEKPLNFLRLLHPRHDHPSLLRRDPPRHRYHLGQPLSPLRFQLAPWCPNWYPNPSSIQWNDG